MYRHNYAPWICFKNWSEPDEINQSINEDLTSGSSPEGDVRDVSSGKCNYKQLKPPEHTCICIDRRESEIQNSAGPLSKAGRSK